jgi:hypothetical protein
VHVPGIPNGFSAAIIGGVGWSRPALVRHFGLRSLGWLGAASVAGGLVACSLGGSYTVAPHGDVNEIRYGRVRVDVPATWPINTEVALCPKYGQVGAFIEEAPPQGEVSCPAIPSVADGVRIGRLLGYPPTTKDVPPVINGHALSPVDLHGTVGYRDTGFLPRTFWVVIPAAQVELFFSYSSDPAIAERVLSTVRM